MFPSKIVLKKIVMTIFSSKHQNVQSLRLQFYSITAISNDFCFKCCFCKITFFSGFPLLFFSVICPLPAENSLFPILSKTSYYLTYAKYRYAFFFWLFRNQMAHISTYKNEQFCLKGRFLNRVVRDDVFLTIKFEKTFP